MSYVSEDDISGGNVGSVKRVHLDKSKGEITTDSIIVKSLSTSSHMRAWTAACGSSQREVHFYHEISHTLPIPIPDVYFSEWNDWRCSQLIIMEDIRTGTPAIRRLSKADGSRAIVEEAMLVAARMHAKYWGATPSTLAQSPLSKYPWLKGYDYIQGRNKGMYEYCKSNIAACWDEIKVAISEGKVGDRQYEVKWSRALVEFIEKTIKDSTWDAYQEYLKTHKHPLTLVHGDYQGTNQLWDEKTKKLYTVDWSEASVGEGPAEVAAYFLFPQVADYHKWEDELLRIYWEELGKQGVDHSSYPFTMCRESYVRGGIDRGIQVLIMMAISGLHCPGLFPVTMIQEFAGRVESFIAQHKMEYSGPYLLLRTYVNPW